MTARLICSWFNTFQRIHSSSKFISRSWFSPTFFLWFFSVIQHFVYSIIDLYFNHHTCGSRKWTVILTISSGKVERLPFATNYWCIIQKRCSNKFWYLFINNALSKRSYQIKQKSPFFVKQRVIFFFYIKYHGRNAND